MAEAEDSQARRVREAFEARSAAELPDLLEQAWAEARDEVAGILKTAAVDALLDQASSPGTPAERAEVVREAPAAAVPTGGQVDPDPDAVADIPRACYVYGIIRAGTAVPGTGGLGLPGTLRTIESGELAAVVSDVDPTAFDEQRWADRATIEVDVRAHDELLRALLELSPLIPLRFGTVVAGERDVERLLEAHRERLVDALRRLSSAAEWGVKATWPTDALHRWVVQDSEELRALDEDASSADSGTSYLLGRRRDRAAERVAENVRDRVVADCHARLVEDAEEAALFSPQRGGEGEELVLNASYLVQEAALQSFEKRCADLVEEYAPAGLAFEVTGPWPPYSFVADLFEEPDR